MAVKVAVHPLLLALIRRRKRPTRGVLLSLMLTLKVDDEKVLKDLLIGRFKVARVRERYAVMMAPDRPSVKRLRLRTTDDPGVTAQREIPGLKGSLG